MIKPINSDYTPDRYNYYMYYTDTSEKYLNIICKIEVFLYYMNKKKMFQYSVNTVRYILPKTGLVIKNYIELVCSQHATELGYTVAKQNQQSTTNLFISNRNFSIDF